MADVAASIGPTLLTTSAVTVFTAGAGGAVLRNLHASNGTGSNSTVTLSIGADAVGTRFWDVKPVSKSGTSVDWSGFVPIAPGAVVQASAGAASTIVLTGGAVQL